MKTHDFMIECTGVANTLGRSKGVQVVFEGKGFSTDGKVVQMPSLPEGYNMDQQAVSSMRGGMSHESAHVLYTDFPTCLPFFEYCHKVNRPLLKDMVNIVEDMFIERNMMEFYPGVEKTFTAITEVGDREFLDAGIPAEVFEGVNITTVSAGLLSYGRREYGGKYGQQVWDMVPKVVQDHVKVWQEHIDKIENSADSIRIGKSIYKLLREDPNLESNPEDFDPNNTDMDDIQEPQGEGEGEGAPTEGDGNLGTEGSMTESFSDIIEKMIEGKTKEGKIGKPKDEPYVSGYRVLSTRYDTILHKSKPNPAINGDEEFFKGSHSEYFEAKAKVQSKITVMKAKLARALVSKEKRDWNYGLEEGRLDTKRLVTAYTGGTNVRKKREDRVEINTVVEILVDCSGSMGYHGKIVMARQVAIVLAECLEGTGIKYEITGFTSPFTVEEQVDLYHSKCNTRETYHRAMPYRFYIFKELNENLRSAQPAISAMTRLKKEHNTDRDAILWAASRLRAQPERRKVLLVLSDGNPEATNVRVPITSLLRSAKEAAAEVEASGIECIGIGIKDASVRSIYSKSVVVNNLDDLAGTVLKQLSKVLLDGRIIT
tara:strand:- start:4216 stop:6012 length:1797 start_codon:yes stop_codon:yes gene_type:complete